MKGADAVISTLGAKGSVIAAAAGAIVAVAKQEGPQRIVMLSSFYVARDRLRAASKLLTGMALGAQIKDKTAGEDALRASGLDWTIVYATRLTNGPDRTYGRPGDHEGRHVAHGLTGGCGFVPPASSGGRPLQPPRRHHHGMTSTHYTRCPYTKGGYVYP